MGKIKVLYLVSSLDRLGPNVVLYNIIKYLDRDTFEPVLCVLSFNNNNESNSMFNDFNKINIKIEFLNLKKIESVLKVKYITKRIKKESPDIIHSQGFRVDMLSSLFFKQFTKKRVSTIHTDVKLELRNSNYNKVYIFFFEKFFFFFQGRLDLRFYITEDQVRLSNLGISSTGINNGVELPISKSRFEMRSFLHLTEKDIIIVASMKLIVRKNPLTLIRAFNELTLNPKYKDVYLLVLGNGELEDKVRILSLSNPNILIKGFVNNPQDYYNASDIFVLPSLAEGQPMSALEAMSFGLPLLLSDIDAHKIFFNLDCNVGLSFDPNSYLDLVEKFQIILNQELSDSKKAVKNLFKSEFTASIMSKKYQNYYKDLLQK